MPLNSPLPLGGPSCARGRGRGVEADGSAVHVAEHGMLSEAHYAREEDIQC
jgi:hypothetical protein